jgi:hypothetical protein
MTDQEIVIVYHVFTHGMDDWLSDYHEAKALYESFAREFGSARLYEERYIDRANDIMESENCLLSIGPFPW